MLNLYVLSHSMGYFVIMDFDFELEGDFVHWAILFKLAQDCFNYFTFGLFYSITLCVDSSMF